MIDYSQEPAQSRVEYLLANGGGGGGGGASSEDFIALQTRVSTLEGDVTVEGSVAKKINDAITSLINGAPASLDTLKEISDWIASNESTIADIQDALYWTKYST